MTTSGDDKILSPMQGEEALLDRLRARGIAYTRHEHAPVFTVEESRALRGDLVGGHVKNLFLRDKKRNIFLVTVEEERPIDLKSLRGPLESKGTLSFGDSDLLWSHLGVKPGSVTPFGIINDRDGKVRVALDKGLMDHARVYCHPLRNDRNIGIAPADLVRFLCEEGHEPLLIDFAALVPNDTPPAQEA